MGNRYAHLIRTALIAGITFIAYSNSFNSAFHFDDYSSIITHPYIQSMHNMPYFFYYNGAPLVGRPVTMATFAVNFAMSGLDPFSYHVTNFFIHLSNVIFIYLLLLLTLKDRMTEHINIAFFAALMFAVHPVHTQAVTYIVQRAEILSTFFYLLSLLIFIKARCTPSLILPPRGGGVGGWNASTQSRPPLARGGWGGNLKSAVLYAASVFSAVLAMGSKETAVTLPITILLYDFFFIADGKIKVFFKRWYIHLLFFSTLLPLFYFMGMSQLISFVSTTSIPTPPTSSVYTDVTTISRSDYFLTQIRVIWTYIKLLILPINQNLDYNYSLSQGLFNPITTLLGGIGIFALFVLAVILFKRQRLVSFFIIWFFLILSPVSSIAVLPDVIFEHRLYLSSLGYFIIVVMVVFKVSDILFRQAKRNGA